ncbi:calcium-binding protein [Nocardioides stalactiti]|uniref:calcium-binding protein n=1 Tax=Nocardioides stalactiti TaxID=2755356 RepID=UPI00160315B2|nr:calcium-binding protein [Nocardioides stalactiti]
MNRSPLARLAAAVTVAPIVVLGSSLSPAAAAPCTITGTPGDDVLTGTSGNDVICGLGGNDLLRGLAGDDELVAGDGNDTIWPGRGSNTVNGGTGTDAVRYDDLATGSVEVRLSAGSVTGAVTDTVVRVENVVGTDRADRLVGSAGPNRLEGLGGNDVIVGRGDSDRLLGAEGNDVIQPGIQDDVADGGDGRDTISFSDLTGSGVQVDLGARSATGQTGVDAITNFEAVVGTIRDDVLIGDGNYNTLNGLAGNDVLAPSTGNRPETVRGGDGRDTLDLGATGFGPSNSVNLATGVMTLNGRVGVIDGVEDVIGGLGPDTIIGDAGPNWISGGTGNDTITGGAGDDTLLGGVGNDSFVTGDGYDFVVGGPSTGVDTISYAAETLGAITAELDDEEVFTSDGTFDSVSGIEHLFGTSFADALQGGLGTVNVTLDGQGGGDSILVSDGFGGDTAISDATSNCVGDVGDTITC